MNNLREKMKRYAQRGGICVHCGSEVIDYKDSGINKDYYYVYECQECKKTGTEWYKLVFIENVKGKDQT